MNTGKRLIQIYIHPDSGPITPMMLDLDAVEVAMNRVPTASSSDDTAVREIARQIRCKFKDIEPENNRRQLVMIMRRWVNADGFNGMVLRLPGSIAGKDTASSGQSMQIVQQVSQLTSALESERHTSASLKLRVHGLEAECKRFKALYEQANSTLIDKRVQDQEFQQKWQQHRKALQQARDEADEAVRETSALKIRMEQLQQQIRSQDHYESELAKLRQSERSAVKAKEQVSDTLARLEQEYATLQEEYRVLLEGPDATETNNDPYDL